VALWIVFVARALALAWAVWWLFFFIVESIVWHTPALQMAPWVAAGLLFVLLALLPWRWEITGGVSLVIAGLATGVAYAVWAPPGLPVAARVATDIVFGLPPLAAGILFLWHHRAAAPVPR
jgi:hypothetical protein